MQFTARDNLSNDPVYAYTAYILSQDKIGPPHTVLDASSLAAVKMPNRDGFMPDRRPEKFPPVAATPHQVLAIPPAN